MAAITFPTKETGDQFSAENCNEIKNSVNSLYTMSVYLDYNGATGTSFLLSNIITSEDFFIDENAVSPLVIPKGVYRFSVSALPSENSFMILGNVSFVPDITQTVQTVDKNLNDTMYPGGAVVCYVDNDFKLVIND